MSTSVETSDVKVTATLEGDQPPSAARSALPRVRGTWNAAWTSIESIVLSPMTRCSAQTGLSLFIWLILFTLGTTIDSRPYRSYLLGYGERYRIPESVPPAGATASIAAAPAIPAGPDVLARWAAFSFGVVFFSYTPTNLALLCIVGAVLGATARRAYDQVAPPENDPQAALRLPMIVCAVHGIFVYVALMSGLFIAEGNLSFDGAAPDQMQARYFRMAATASIFSIAAGTSPNFIRDLAGLFQIDRLRRKP